MLIADKKGKFPLEFDKEDVLTSIVFGTIDQFDLISLLKEFLKKAKIGEDGKTDKKFRQNVDGIKKVEFNFWPQLKGGIPDVVLVCNPDKQDKWIIVIEAKYGSAKGEIDEESLNQVESDYGDQLVKYYKICKEENNCDVYVLYVTHHSIFWGQPQKDIKSSIEKNNAPDFNKRIGWIPWRELTPLLEEESKKQKILKRYLEDLICYLERRGFAPFKGNWINDISEPLPEKPEIIFYKSSELKFKGDWGRGLKSIPGKREFIFYKRLENQNRGGCYAKK